MGFALTAEVIVAIIGAIATLLGGVAASEVQSIFKVLTKVRAIRATAGKASLPAGFGDNSGSVTPPQKPRLSKARAQVATRIAEAESLRSSEEWRARRAKLASNSLVFGQYVIGGAMATSFLQANLSSKVIGIFGVLVLVASVFRQHYHPETNAQNANLREAQYDALIRQSEDRLVVIDTTANDDADDPTLVLELLERISAEITRIKSTPDLTLPKAENSKKKK